MQGTQTYQHGSKMDELKNPFSLIFRIVHDKILVLVKVYLSVTITVFRAWILATISLHEERYMSTIYTVRSITVAKRGAERGKAT